jgi:hypothetical protein
MNNKYIDQHVNQTPILRKHKIKLNSLIDLRVGKKYTHKIQKVFPFLNILIGKHLICLTNILADKCTNLIAFKYKTYVLVSNNSNPQYLLI